MKIISSSGTTPDCREANRLLNNLRAYGATCISKYKYDSVPTILFSSDPDTSDYDMIGHALEAEGYTELTWYGSDPYVTEYLSPDKSICAKLIQNEPNDIRLEVSNELIEGSESIKCTKDSTMNSTVVVFECTNDFTDTDMTQSLSQRLDRFGVNCSSVTVDGTIYTVTLNCKSAEDMHVAKVCIENCGFFKRWIDVPDSDKDSILSSIDDNDYEENDSPYLYLESKQVPDSDGFYTDYTLYLNTDTGNYICMFGDTDMYEPDEDYADYVTDSESEAYEWFETYGGFEDDEGSLTLSMRYTDEELVQAIQHKLDISKRAAKIVYNWYNDEGEFDSQDDIVDTLDYIKDDIFDMLDAATDPDEKALVEAELNE